MDPADKVRRFEDRQLQTTHSLWSAMITLNGIIVSGVSIAIGLEGDIQHVRTVLVCSFGAILSLLFAFFVLREIDRVLLHYFVRWHPFKGSKSEQDILRKQKNTEKEGYKTTRGRLVTVVEIAALILTAVSVAILLGNALRLSA